MIINSFSSEDTYYLLLYQIDSYIAGVNNATPSHIITFILFIIRLGLLRTVWVH